jgi:protocatechuate 3,4-dioxygenase beta subunit
MERIAALLCAAWSTFAPQQPPEKVAIAVSGTVLDGEFHALAGVAVGLTEQENGDLAAALAHPLGKSGADGGFTVEVTVAKDHPSWLVFGGGRWATALRQLTDHDAPRLDAGTFAMAPGITGAGRVRDAKGQPVAGALVVVSDLLDSRAFLQQGREGMAVHCRSWGQTDHSGIFRLPGMVESAGLLTASMDGCYDEVLQPVGAGEPLDVTLSPAPSVRGRVVDEAGKGVEGLVVFRAGSQARSDAEGRFVLNLRRRDDLPGTVGTHRWSGGKFLTAEVQVDAPGKEIELALRPSMPVPVEPVRVVAHGPDGAPLQEFTAYVSWNPQNQLQYRPDAMLLSWIGNSKDEWQAAAHDGTAAVRGSRRDGDVALVFVQAKGLAWGRVETGISALGGDPVLVQLGREAVIRGRVTDAATGKPIAGAEVIPTQRLTDNERGFYGANGFRSVRDLLGSPSAAKTDADGRYELRALPAGDTDVFVYVQGRTELAPELR